MTLNVHKCDRIQDSELCVPRLFATQFAQVHHWSFHFLCSLGIALVNNVILLLVFRGKTQDGEITAMFYSKQY